METNDMILAETFCVHHQIALSFIQQLRNQGMIETVIVEGNIFIPESELVRLEKIMHLHFDLDINLEGIETINYLLDRITHMQQEITTLNNRLKAWEDI